MGASLALWVDYLSGKKSTHQITMLNPETKELEELIPRDGFRMPPPAEDQVDTTIPPVTESAKKAFEDRFSNEYDNLT